MFKYECVLYCMCEYREMGREDYYYLYVTYYIALYLLFVVFLNQLWQLGVL